MADDENGVRYGAIKVFHGASVSAYTGWVTEPYIGIENKFGLRPARSQEDLNELLLKIHRAGLQAWVHCNGDRELDMVVTAFEYVLNTASRADHRHRLEHCSVVTPELLRRIKAAGLVVVPHSYMCGSTATFLTPTIRSAGTPFIHRNRCSISAFRAQRTAIRL